VERKPCGPLGNCNNLIRELAIEPYPNKIFPEEVENIKNFLHDPFTTNVNSYSLGGEVKSESDMDDDQDISENKFLQGEEIDISGNKYKNKYNYYEGIDSSNLNKIYLNMNNNRIIPKNLDDSEVDLSTEKNKILNNESSENNQIYSKNGNLITYKTVSSNMKNPENQNYNNNYESPENHEIYTKNENTIHYKTVSSNMKHFENQNKSDISELNEMIRKDSYKNGVLKLENHANIQKINKTNKEDINK